jgi:hypothetical protein
VRKRFLYVDDGFIAQSESVEAARSITGKVLVRRLDEFRPRGSNLRTGLRSLLTSAPSLLSCAHPQNSEEKTCSFTG